MQCGSVEYKTLASFDDFAARAQVATDERKPIFAYIETHPDSAFKDFIQCKKCGFARIEPMPSPATLTSFYQNYYANSQ
jgi:hypothetical protein